MKKHSLMSNLSKAQKFMIIFWGLYELIMGIIATDKGRPPFRLFLILSIPCILYWSGVWIWGFGYLLQFFKKMIYHISHIKKYIVGNKRISLSILVAILLSIGSYFIISKPSYQNLDTDEQFFTSIEFSTLRNEAKGLGAVVVILDGVKTINNLCEKEGYVPHRYIDGMLKLKNDTDFDIEVITFLMKTGFSKEEAINFVKKLHTYTRLISQDLLKKISTKANFTKRQYCEMYDSHAELFISNHLQYIKKEYPSTYKKYFEN